ncbi:hypothetical protein LTR56_015295 [Elasticomyces elasticus]|nr:hypothetical protein LTR56_015295 [Elasticomyces elasticus]KAK3640393.1 hypothetical protein LTR22_017050 [Elasticomyces elasticus]KAK4913643.1 hypothetical protein LTR49_018057 [Elasticomyces elasticus]KAK5753070.1 hypothetical protein LTS12_016850 [Elasticomyces elasticus]
MSTWYYLTCVHELPRIWYAWEQGSYFPKPDYMENTLTWRPYMDGLEGLAFPKVSWQPWPSRGAELLPPRRNLSEIRSLLLVHPRLGNELLPVWAENVTHELPLDITFWRSDSRQEATYFDHLDYIGGVSSAKLARAVFSTLREFLTGLDVRFGLAQKVRHIKLTACFEAHKYDCSTTHIHRLAATKLVQKLERLEWPLVHEKLRVELEVTCMQALPDEWARRTYTLAQRPLSNVTGRDADPPWRYTRDLVEVKISRPIAPGSPFWVAEWAELETIESKPE